MTSTTVAANRLTVVSTVGPCGCATQKCRLHADATTTPATKHSISRPAVTDSNTSPRKYPSTARCAFPVINVTKYPAEWVKAVAPSTPASAASTHDSRASLSNVSRSMQPCFHQNRNTRRAAPVTQMALISIGCQLLTSLAIDRSGMGSQPGRCRDSSPVSYTALSISYAANSSAESRGSTPDAAA